MLKVTQARVLISEFTKFRTVRSTVWTLLVAVVLMIGLSTLFAAVTASQYHTFGPADRASFNPVSTSLGGMMFAVVAFGVLGVLMISGEYSTGMIRSSLTAVPRRLPVLWGKLAVFAGVIFSVSLVASFISFFLGQALLNSHQLGVSITAPGALRSVIGAALYVTVAGMIGVALGALFRNTAAGIATFAGVLRDPAADRPAARLDQRPPVPVPALERGRGRLGRGAGRHRRAVSVDGLRAAVRVRRRPHRRCGPAAATRRRLTGGAPGENVEHETDRGRRAPSEPHRGALGARRACRPDRRR